MTEAGHTMRNPATALHGSKQSSGEPTPEQSSSEMEARAQLGAKAHQAEDQNLDPKPLNA